MSRPRLLAVASGGGHWTQLLRMRRAFEDFDVSYVSTFEGHVDNLGGAKLYIVPDASRFDVKPFGTIFWRALKVMVKERPKVIVTTGSAPMLAFMLLGRMMGIHTLWIDSIANTQKMSSSGRIARKFVNQCVSQWPEVAEKEGVAYWGQVL
ncbi:hypothetical protein [Sphingosinicella sp. BN140058]|uniref:hypothetical protein n=1 Tax=Sphingosinicella sp. BN140058 TaxID=1892855 RepID=UPI001012D59E|nr:hypothetical protein [Sphingosinicella sp. BN140058]QAY77493.1 hypothetical protein ETR14_14005 [Sphingosinicella sp. BN140058]